MIRRRRVRRRLRRTARRRPRPPAPLRGPGLGPGPRLIINLRLYGDTKANVNNQGVRTRRLLKRYQALLPEQSTQSPILLS